MDTFYTNAPLAKAASGSYHVALIKFCISFTNNFITSKLMGLFICCALTSSYTLLFSYGSLL